MVVRQSLQPCSFAARIVNPYDTITLERTSDVKRKFTYVDEESSEAVKSGMESGHKDNGLIKVVFKPAVQMKTINYVNQSFGLKKKKMGGLNMYSNDTLGLENAGYGGEMRGASKNYSSGGTLLGGSSSQNFGSVQKIQNYDTTNITEIALRLVTNNDLDVEEEEEFVPIARKKTSYPKRLEDSGGIAYDDTCPFALHKYKQKQQPYGYTGYDESGDMFISYGGLSRQPQYHYEDPIFFNDNSNRNDESDRKIFRNSADEY